MVCKQVELNFAVMLGAADAKPEEFENGGFTLKTYQMFSVHTTPEAFKNAAKTAGLALGNHDHRDAILFDKLRFQNVFGPHENETLANSSGFKSIFQKLRFRDESVWTVGLTVELKLCFQISPA